MTDLTEKNLEASLLALAKTGKPVKIRPTTWFGNPAKTAQWHTCPNCAKSSPLTINWVGLTDEEVVALKMVGRDLEFVSMTALRRFARDIEATLKEKNT